MSQYNSDYDTDSFNSPSPYWQKMANTVLSADRKQNLIEHLGLEKQATLEGYKKGYIQFAGDADSGTAIDEETGLPFDYRLATHVPYGYDSADSMESVANSAAKTEFQPSFIAGLVGKNVEDLDESDYTNVKNYQFQEMIGSLTNPNHQFSPYNKNTIYEAPKVDKIPFMYKVTGVDKYGRNLIEAVNPNTGRSISFDAGSNPYLNTKFDLYDYLDTLRNRERLKHFESQTGKDFVTKLNRASNNLGLDMEAQLKKYNANTSAVDQLIDQFGFAVDRAKVGTLEMFGRIMKRLPGTDREYWDKFSNSKDGSPTLAEKWINPDPLRRYIYLKKQKDAAKALDNAIDNTSAKDFARMLYIQASTLPEALGDSAAQMGANIAATAATGAAVGSIVPGAGTAIGTAAGFVAGVLAVALDQTLMTLDEFENNNNGKQMNNTQVARTFAEQTLAAMPEVLFQKIGLGKVFGNSKVGKIFNNVSERKVIDKLSLPKGVTIAALGEGGQEWLQDSLTTYEAQDQTKKKDFTDIAFSRDMALSATAGAMMGGALHGTAHGINAVANHKAFKQAKELIDTVSERLRKETVDGRQADEEASRNFIRDVNATVATSGDKDKITLAKELREKSKQPGLDHLAVDTALKAAHTAELEAILDAVNNGESPKGAEASIGKSKEEVFAEAVYYSNYNANRAFQRNHLVTKGEAQQARNNLLKLADKIGVSKEDAIKILDEVDVDIRYGSGGYITYASRYNEINEKLKDKNLSKKDREQLQEQKRGYLYGIMRLMATEQAKAKGFADKAENIANGKSFDTVTYPTSGRTFTFTSSDLASGTYERGYKVYRMVRAIENSLNEMRNLIKDVPATELDEIIKTYNKNEGNQRFGLQVDLSRIDFEINRFKHQAQRVRSRSKTEQSTKDKGRTLTNDELAADINWLAQAESEAKVGNNTRISSTKHGKKLAQVQNTLDTISDEDLEKVKTKITESNQKNPENVQNVTETLDNLVSDNAKLNDYSTKLKEVREKIVSRAEKLLKDLDLNKFRILKEDSSEEANKKQEELTAFGTKLVNIGTNLSNVSFSSEDTLLLHSIEDNVNKLRKLYKINAKIIKKDKSQVEDIIQSDNAVTESKSPTPVKTSKALGTKESPIQIYSDGSHIKGTDQIGYGAVFTHNGKEYFLSGTNEDTAIADLKAKFPNKKFSNATMEMLALTTVLETIANLGVGEHITINQDYKGAVNYSGLWEYSEGSSQRDAKAWKAKEKYIAYLVQKAIAAINTIEANGGSVSLRWVKGHQKVGTEEARMNDLADKYAKSRDISNNFAEAYSDVTTKEEPKVEEKVAETDNTPKRTTTKYVNHSGGAIGSDTVWGTIGTEYGIENRHYYGEGAKTPNGNTEVKLADLKEGFANILKANKSLQRRVPAINTYIGKLLARNWMQVKNADAIFAIGNIVFKGEKNKAGYISKSTQVDGGTGWAVQMAIDNNKPVHVFNQRDNQWYFFDYHTDTWNQEPTPTLTKNFAGAATDEISTSGIQAIHDIYNKTFGTNLLNKSNLPNTVARDKSQTTQPDTDVQVNEFDDSTTATTVVESENTPFVTQEELEEQLGKVETKDYDTAAILNDKNENPEDNRLSNIVVPDNSGETFQLSKQIRFGKANFYGAIKSDIYTLSQESLKAFNAIKLRLQGATDTKGVKINAPFKYFTATKVEFDENGQVLKDELGREVKGSILMNNPYLRVLYEMSVPDYFKTDNHRQITFEYNETVIKAIDFSLREVIGSGILDTLIDFNSMTMEQKLATFGFKEEQTNGVNISRLTEVVASVGVPESNIANVLGETIAKNLGMRMNENGDYGMYEQIVAGLGAFAVDYAIELGLVESTVFNPQEWNEAHKDVEEKHPIKYTVHCLRLTDKAYPKIRAYRTQWKGTLLNKDTLERAKDGLVQFKTPDTENTSVPLFNHYFPRGNERAFVRNTGDLVRISKAQDRAIRKLERQAHRIDEDLTEFLLGKLDKLKKVLGYKTKEEISILSKDEQLSAEGKNNSIIAQIEALVDAYAHQKALGKRFDGIYFKHFVSRNGRFFVDSITLNPQTQKLHRFLCLPVKAWVTYDPSKMTEKDILKENYALAQAFDVLGTDESITELGEKFNNLTLEQVLKMRDYLLEDERVFKAKCQEEFGLKLGIETLSQALRATQHLIKKKQTNGKSFETTLAVENDSATSGYALKFLSMPLPEMLQFLEKVGIFSADTKRTPTTMHVLKKAEGFLDPYKTTAVKTSEILEELSQDNRIDDREQRKQTHNYFNLWKNYIEQANKYWFRRKLPEGKDPKEYSKIEANVLSRIYKGMEKALPKAINGVVSSELRTLMKSPTMVFGYSAGINSIVRKVSSEVMEEFVSNYLQIEAAGGLAEYYKANNITDKEDKDLLGTVYATMNGVVSSLVIKKDNETLADVLRNKLYADIRVKLGNRIVSFDKLFECIIRPTYGEAIGNTLADMYKTYVEINDMMINVTCTMANWYREVFKDKIKEKKIANNGRVSVKEVKEIEEELEDLLPYVTLANNTAENDAKMLLLNTTKEYNREYRTQSVITRNGKVIQGPGIYAKVKEPSLPGRAGAVSPIHGMDGADVTYTANELLDHIGITFIHDAAVTSFLHGDIVSNKMNTYMASMCANHDIFSNMLIHLDRMIEAYAKHTGKSMEEIIHTIVIDGNGRKVTYKDEEGNERYVQLGDYLEYTVYPMADRIARSKEQFFNGNTIFVANVDSATEEGIGTYTHDTQGDGQQEFKEVIEEKHPELVSTASNITDSSQVSLNNDSNKTKKERITTKILKKLLKSAEFTKEWNIDSYLKAFTNFINKYKTKLNLEEIHLLQSSLLEIAEYIYYEEDGSYVYINDSRNPQNKDYNSFIKFRNELIRDQDSAKKLKEKQESFIDFLISEIDRQYNRIMSSQQYSLLGDTSIDLSVKMGSTARGYQTVGAIQQSLNQALTSTEARVNFITDLQNQARFEDALACSDGHAEHLKQIIKDITPEYLADVVVKVIENGLFNAGTVNTSTSEIELVKDAKTQIDPITRMAVESDMSMAEIYAHELVHLGLEYAFNHNDVFGFNKEIQQLQQIQREAMDIITVEDFMPTNYDPSLKEMYETHAKLTWDYIFNNPEGGLRGLKEFCAYAATNERLRNKLTGHVSKAKSNFKKKTLIDQIIYVLHGIFDVLFKGGKFSEIFGGAHQKITGNVTLHQKTLLEDLDKLIYNMYHASAKAADKANWHPLKLTEYMFELMGKFANWGDKIGGKKIKDFLTYSDRHNKNIIGAIRMPVNGNFYDKAKLLASVMRVLPTSALQRREFRKALTDLWGWQQQGLRMSIFRDITEPDTASSSLELLALRTKTVDINSKAIEASSYNDLVEAFDHDLTTLERVSLTNALLYTNAQCLYNGNNYDEFIRLITDDDRLANEINGIKELLYEKYGTHTARFHINMCMGRARFFVFEKGNEMLTMNAENQAEGRYAGDERVILDDKDIDTVRRLATLMALQHTNSNYRQVVASLNKEGIENYLKSAQEYVKESREGVKTKTLFGKDTIVPIIGKEYIMDGYTKQLFDPNIEQMTDLVTPQRIQELKNAGWELAYKYNENRVTGTTMMGLYTRPGFTRRTDGNAMVLTSEHAVGSALRDTAFEYTAKYNMNIQPKDLYNTWMSEADAIQNRLRKWMFRKELTFDDFDKLSAGYTPIIAPNGISDYRITMNREHRRNILKIDEDGLKILSKMYGSLSRKAQAGMANKLIVQFLEDDMNKNMDQKTFRDKEGHKYIELTRTTPNKYLQEMWSVIPKELMDRIEKGGLYVREDWLQYLLGVPSMSILDTDWMKKVPGYKLKRAIAVAEMIFKTFGFLNKAQILFRMPKVFISNILSNFNYHLLTHQDITKIFRSYVANAKGIRDYLDNRKELNRIEFKRRIGTATEEDLKKINWYKNKLDSNLVAPLMKKGMYQAIVEDMNPEELDSIGKVTKWMKSHERISKLPNAVKWAGKQLYMTQGTFFYDFIYTATQYSDFVARITEYQLIMSRVRDNWKQDVKEGKTNLSYNKYYKEAERNATVNVLNAFINYDKPQSKWEQYFNDMGILMFTKFAKRIQHVLTKQLIDRPIHALMFLLGQHFVWDTDDIMEQNVFNKHWSALLHNPVNNMVEALVPMPVQALTGMKDIW